MSRTEEKENKSFKPTVVVLCFLITVGETVEDTFKTKSPLFDRFLGRYITHALTHAYNTQYRYVKRKIILLLTLQGREA